MDWNSLQSAGLTGLANVYENLEPTVLVEHALHLREGLLADNGAFVVQTGKFTGRSPKDKYIVEEPTTQEQVWWGNVNHPLSESQFESLWRRTCAYLNGKTVYSQDVFGGQMCAIASQFASSPSTHGTASLRVSFLCAPICSVAT